MDCLEDAYVGEVMNPKTSRRCLLRAELSWYARDRKTFLKLASLQVQEREPYFSLSVLAPARLCGDATGRLTYIQALSVHVSRPICSNLYCPREF